MQTFQIAMASGKIDVQGERLTEHFFLHRSPLTDQLVITHTASGYAVPFAVPKSRKFALQFATDLEAAFDFSQVKMTKSGRVLKSMKATFAKAPLRALYEKHKIPGYGPSL